jgi:twitching motility protein PilT
MFPPAEQNQVRARLADALYATISQRLVRTLDGKSMLAAQEIMITSPGIREAISDAQRVGEIYTYISKGKKTSGSQTFDQHLLELLKAELISQEEAMSVATSPEDFLRNHNFSQDDF